MLSNVGTMVVLTALCNKIARVLSVVRTNDISYICRQRLKDATLIDGKIDARLEVGKRHVVAREKKGASLGWTPDRQPYPVV